MAVLDHHTDDPQIAAFRERLAELEGHPERVENLDAEQISIELRSRSGDEGA